MAIHSGLRGLVAAGLATAGLLLSGPDVDAQEASRPQLADQMGSFLYPFRDGRCSFGARYGDESPESYVFRMQSSAPQDIDVDLDCVTREYSGRDLTAFRLAHDPVAAYVVAVVEADRRHSRGALCSGEASDLIDLLVSSAKSGEAGAPSDRPLRLADPFYLSGRMAELCGDLASAERFYLEALEQGIWFAESHWRRLASRNPYSGPGPEDR